MDVGFPYLHLIFWNTWGPVWETALMSFCQNPCVYSVSIPLNSLMSLRCAMISCIAPCSLVFWVDAKHCGFHRNECFGHLGMFINIFGICSGIQLSYLEKSGLWGSCVKDSLRNNKSDAQSQVIYFVVLSKTFSVFSLVLRTGGRGSWPQPCEATRPFPSRAFSWSFPWSFACAERGQPPHPTPSSAAPCLFWVVCCKLPLPGYPWAPDSSVPSVQWVPWAASGLPLPLPRDSFSVVSRQLWHLFCLSLFSQGLLSWLLRLSILQASFFFLFFFSMLQMRKGGKSVCILEMQVSIFSFLLYSSQHCYTLPSVIL